MPDQRRARPPVMPWLTTLTTALVAVVIPAAIVVFFEARPVWATLDRHLAASDHVAQVYCQLLLELTSRFGLIVGIQLLLALGAVSSGHLGRHLRPAWTAFGATLASAVVVARIHLELVVEPTMVGAAPTAAASVALWLGLSATHTVALLAAARQGRVRRLAAVLGAGAAGAGAVAIYLDHVLFPHDYLALHTTLNGASLALLQAAALCGWALLATPGRALDRCRWPMTLGATAVLVAFGAVAVVGASAEVGPRVMSRLRSESQLGRYRNAPLPEAACTLPRQPLALDVALETVSQHAPLPTLPPDFEIDRHDIVFVTVEALRADHTFPAEATLTPNLARLVERGATLWTQALAPSTNTLQTLSAVLTMTFTSMAPIDILRRDWDGELRDELPTVPQLFARAGFETLRASDRYRVYHQLARGFDHHIHADTTQGADVDALLTERVLDTLATIAPDRRTFTWLFLASTHDPYYIGRDHEDDPYARYRLGVAEVDRQLGILLDGLSTLGRLENTVIVLMGDHGEEFGEHGATGHNATLYDELVRVPLLVWLPGGDRQGRVVNEPISTTLVWPWLLLTARDEAMAQAARTRLTTELGPALRATDGAVVSERLAHHTMPTAVRGRGLKLIYDHITGDTELYDLRADPTEQRDLALDDGVAGREQLEAALQRWLALRACTRRYRLRTTRPLVDSVLF